MEVISIHILINIVLHFTNTNWYIYTVIIHIQGFIKTFWCGIWNYNKANLRDLIAATGLVILLKLDWNCQFFSLCDLEISWMTSKNYRAPLLHYIKLCVSSQSPPWIQTGVTVPKCTIRVKIGDFFVLCDIEIWQMTSKNNRAPLLCYIKLCASFQTHWWIQN